MKKLNLKLDDIKEMLTKEQMKKITGGYSTHCSESCGKSGTVNSTSCDSFNGVCSHEKDFKWISCDGTKYDCPAA